MGAGARVADLVIGAPRGKELAVASGGFGAKVL